MEESTIDVVVVKLGCYSPQAVRTGEEEADHAGAILGNLYNREDGKISHTHYEHAIDIVFGEEAVSYLLALAFSLWEAENEQVAYEPVNGVVGAEGASEFVEGDYNIESVD